jgi:tetratricopeptide (TPR) repeat protein
MDLEKWIFSRNSSSERESDLERQRDEHINTSELESILRSPDWHFGSKEDDMPEARRHLAACDFCRDLVSLHMEQGGRLAQLSRPPDTPRTPGCPPESQWPELSAGLVYDDQAAELFRHAATCDHCGPLLRQSLEDFVEEVTPAEQEFLAGLKSARPESQQSMAARLVAITRPNSILDWLRQVLDRFRQRPVASIPLPAWVYAGVAVMLAAVMAVVTLNSAPPVENLLASAYTSQRNLEVRIPDAAYGPLRVVKGSGGVSRLDGPPALLQGEAMIASELAKSPDDPRWLQARGLAELLDRDSDSAIADFQRCLTLQPASSRLMVQLACAHFQRAEAANSQPDYQEALDLLNRALKIAPDDPVALFNRAIVYQRMHLYNQAVEDWRHNLRVDPRSKWADEARRRLAEVDRSDFSNGTLSQGERAEATKRTEALAKAQMKKRFDYFTGTITLKKQPSRMRLSIRQISGVPMQGPSVYDDAPDQLILPVGQYILTFDAPGYKQDIVGPIGITTGQNVNVEVKLGR